MKIEKTSATSPLGEITLYTLTNAQGGRVTLSSLGAGIVSVVVPDKNKVFTDIAIGYTAQSYAEEPLHHYMYWNVMTG